ncbi:MAG: hypothetical protein QOC94_1860 [Actinoplanes sp.]|jgi:drug/metabolite transporter (DMT)-like permease|nr:hypothetical protein [Actinoplanes sp.]
MTAAGWAALSITIFGAFSYAAGSILQALGARRSIGTVRTMAHPLYLIGVGFDILAWAGSMVALRELAVYQVQAILAGSLAITVIAARFFLGSRVRGCDVTAILITIAALTVLAMSAGPQEEVAPSSALRYGLCVAALVTAVVGWGATKIAPPGVVAALAGLALGGAALTGRALILPPQPLEHLSATAMTIVTEPLSGALVAFAAAGMAMYTDALAKGDVGPVTAVLWISEVVAPSVVALALLGDTVLPGWQLAAVVATLVTVGAAVVLATAPATGDTAVPEEAPALPAAHRPAALGAREYGTILWWGPTKNPLPIWRPPDRSDPAWAAGPAIAEPPRAIPMWTDARPALEPLPPPPPQWLRPAVESRPSRSNVG